jgi:hypothetical protein
MWPFKKKKEKQRLTINKGFYLSLLAGPELLPPLLQIINPQGSNQAVKGYGAPLDDKASKDMLNQPLIEGSYVLSSPEKLTLIQMSIVPVSKLKGFSLPNDPVLCSGVDLTPEKLNRARSTTTLIDFVFVKMSPDVYQAVQFLVDCVSRFASLTNGIIGDSLAETYRYAHEINPQPKVHSLIDFRSIGSVKAIRQADGVWVSTRGLCKFNLPEFEMYGMPDELVNTSAQMLISAGQQSLIEQFMYEGETAFAIKSPLLIVNGTRNKEFWKDRPVLEFKDPDEQGAKKGVQAWKETQS